MMRKLLLPLLLMIAPGGAFATMWDESVAGDLSGSGLAPSQLTVGAGSNVVRGSFRATDLDYLSIFIPDGYALAAIITGTGNNSGLSRSFIGVEQGPIMTVPPNTSSAAGLLGWTHFGVADGVNLLPQMSLARLGSTGFSGPLPAGFYTFWFNETSDEPNLTFDLDFRVTAVPLPPAIALLAAPMLLVSVRRRVRSAA